MSGAKIGRMRGILTQSCMRLGDPNVLSIMGGCPAISAHSCLCVGRDTMARKHLAACMSKENRVSWFHNLALDAC